MEDSIRQKQVAKIIMEEMSDIFQREGMNIIHGGMVSISKVSITPDLLEVRIFLSLFKINDPEALMLKIRERTWEFRKLLGQRMKNQLRRVPEIQFILDDTMEHVQKMDELFRKIEEDRKAHSAS